MELLTAMFTSLDMFNIVGIIGIAIVFIAYIQSGKEIRALQEINRCERELERSECENQEATSEQLNAPRRRQGSKID